ncbi:MAG: ABC transporter permease subunit [Clostridia bacterium]
MISAGLLVIIIYTIIPFFGNVMAFQNFKPIKGFFRSEWIGFENFEYMFKLKDTYRIFRNSLLIASGKLVLTLVFSILFAIVLSEARGVRTKKLVQTVCFLPHFLSWVILASIFKNIFGDTGLINEMLKKLGIISESVNFLGSNSVFPWLLIGTDVWKEFGYGAVIFIAALAGINPELYEAAEIDGAGRMAKIRHITLPGIAVTIVLVATLNLANILNAGFDQVYNLYSPVVYESGDIIDTYVYRMSFVNAQYSVATAVGLLKSVVSLIMITSSYVLAKKFTGYRLF